MPQNSRSRRRFLTSAGLTSAALLAGCAASSGGEKATETDTTTAGHTTKTASADDTTTLRVFDQEAGFVSPYKDAVSRFEEQHDVNIEIVGGLGASIVDKYLVEKRNDIETADVLAGWIPQNLLKAQLDGKLARPEPPELADRIPERFRDPLLVRHVAAIVPAYNPNKLDAAGIEPPKSYAALADDRFSGRVEVVDPVKVGSAMKVVAYIANNLGGWDYWKSLHENGAKVASGYPQVPKDLISSDTDTAVGILGLGLGLPAEKKGKPIENVIPTEGAIGSSHALAVNPDSPNPELTRQFIKEVKFDEKVLEFWTNKYLPVTLSGHELPDDSPLSLDDIRLVDWKWMIEHELDLKVKWQNIFG
ncbi:MAG: extracellular solute-binding protein [Haloferacaceae archaeon]